MGFTWFLKKGTPFAWDEIAQKSFDDLKVILINAPMLHPPYYYRDYFFYLAVAHSTCCGHNHHHIKTYLGNTFGWVSENFSQMV